MVRQAGQVFYQKFTLWIKEVRGATAIEYALVATGISLAIAVSVYFFGEQLSTLFYDNLPEALGS